MSDHSKRVTQRASLEKEWAAKLKKSPSATVMIKLINDLNVTGLEAVTWCISYLCTEIDELKKENHRLKSRIGML